MKKVFGGGVKKFGDTQNIDRDRQQFNNNREPRNYNKDNNKRRNEAKGKVAVEQLPSKPPEKVCLFNFLEDKLNVNDLQTTSTVNENVPESNHNRNFHSNTYQKPVYSTQQRNEQQGYTGFRRENSGNVNRYHNQQQRTVSSATNNFNGNGKPTETKNAVAGTTTTNTSTSRNNTSDNSAVNAITNNVEKMSVNSQFASRSLKQHLNINRNKNSDEGVNSKSITEWKIGDSCLAKYWEDGKVSCTKTFVVSKLSFTVVLSIIFNITFSFTMPP